MQFKVPRNDAKYRWTQHVVRKMLFYGLSPDRVKRVIRHPQRMEEGIAPGTLAAMCPYGTSSTKLGQGAGEKKWKSEIWVMWAEKPKTKTKTKIEDMLLVSQKIIITAWRYPGVSKVRDQIPIPQDILLELQNEGVI